MKILFPLSEVLAQAVSPKAKSRGLAWGPYPSTQYPAGIGAEGRGHPLEIPGLLGSQQLFKETLQFRGLADPTRFPGQTNESKGLPRTSQDEPLPGSCLENTCEGTSLHTAACSLPDPGLGTNHIQISIFTERFFIERASKVADF